MGKVIGSPTTTPININNFVGKASSINNKVSGESIHITDSSENKLNNLVIYGKTTQAAEPTLDTPQELVSIGAEAFNVLVTGNNLFNPTFVTANRLTEIDSYSNIVIDTGTRYNSADGIKARVKNPSDSTLSNLYMVFENPCLKFNHDYTLIADVTVDNNYNDVTSSNYNLIYFRSPKGTIINTAKVDVSKGKIAAYIPAEDMTPNSSYPNSMWLQCNLYHKDITLKNIMLLQGDYRNNIPEYEDYKEQVLAVEAKTTLGNADNRAGLVGIPVESGGNYTDESGQSWIANTIDFKEGKLYRRVWARQFPTSGWVMGSAADDGDYIFYRETDWGVGEHLEVLCNYFPNKIMPTEGHGIWIYKNESGNAVICIKAPFVHPSEVEEFIATNRPYVYYAISSIVATTLTTAELEQYKALTSYYPTTRVINDVDAGMEVEYVADTKNYIDNKFAELTALVLEG